MMKMPTDAAVLIPNVPMTPKSYKAGRDQADRTRLLILLQKLETAIREQVQADVKVQKIQKEIQELMDSTISRIPEPTVASADEASHPTQK